MERAHGLPEDESWAPGEGPPEWEALRSEYDRIASELTAAALEEHGEAEIAELHRNRRAEFDRHYEEGRRFFLGVPML